GAPGATRDLRIAIILAGALTLTEAARGYVLTGFPWALPAYLWIDTPLAQLAAWVGPYGLTALTLLVGSLPVLGLAALPSHRTLGGAAAAAGVALFVGGWLAGNAREAAAPALPPEPTVIRLVQPNAPQRLKWDPAYVPLFYQRLIEGSAAPADPALGAADVVIWPETAVAFLPEREPEARAQMAAAAGAPLILGALHAFPDPEGDGGTAYTNALYVLDQGGEIAARYDKHHLVPFGEYMPFRSLFAALGLRQLAQHGLFRSGPGPATLALPGLAAFAPLICYEAIFPSEVAAAVDAGPSRPAYLLQITNDAWFGTWGGPQQHLAQARLRAIEQGLPLVRAANTGISAVIDSHGRVTAAIPLGQHGFLDAALPAATNPPLYARLGDVPGYIFALLLFVARFLRSRT
ncbi:MAG: apolipoprotein N-acyltransferase, partial [Pseudomonadota bacterium]